jgi:hypothetical protein
MGVSGIENMFQPAMLYEHRRYEPFRSVLLNLILQEDSAALYERVTHA